MLSNDMSLPFSGSHADRKRRSSKQCLNPRRSEWTLSSNVKGQRFRRSLNSSSHARLHTDARVPSNLRGLYSANGPKMQVR